MATGEIVYIGKGQGDRMRHPFTGRSHSAELNRLHFEGVPLVAEALEINLDNRQATISEALLIEKFNPRFNVTRPPVIRKGWKRPREWHAHESVADQIAAKSPAWHEAIAKINAMSNRS